jgi:hypothetical protein
MVTLELAVVHVRTFHDDVLASRRALASSIRTRGSTKYLRDLTGSISTRDGFHPLFDLVLFGSTASNAQFRELIPTASDRAQLLHSMRVTGADKAVYVVSSRDRGVVFVVQIADSGDINQEQTPLTTAFDSGSLRETRLAFSRTSCTRSTHGLRCRGRRRDATTGMRRGQRRWMTQSLATLRMTLGFPWRFRFGTACRS